MDHKVFQDFRACRAYLGSQDKWDHWDIKAILVTKVTPAVTVCGVRRVRLDGMEHRDRVVGLDSKDHQDPQEKDVLQAMATPRTTMGLVMSMVDSSLRLASRVLQDLPELPDHQDHGALRVRGETSATLETKAPKENGVTRVPRGRRV